MKNLLSQVICLDYLLAYFERDSFDRNFVKFDLAREFYSFQLRHDPNAWDEMSTATRFLWLVNHFIKIVLIGRMKSVSEKNKKKSMLRFSFTLTFEHLGRNCKCWSRNRYRQFCEPMQESICFEYRSFWVKMRWRLKWTTNFKSLLICSVEHSMKN